MDKPRTLVFQYIVPKYHLPDSDAEPYLLRLPDGRVYGVATCRPHIWDRTPTLAGLSDPVFAPGTYEFQPGQEIHEDPERPLTVEREDVGEAVRISVWRE